MHLFTFAFEPMASKHIGIVASGTLILLLVVEMLSMKLLSWRSETFQRVSAEYSAAVSLRQALPGKPANVLLVGNSLLLEGLDINALQDQLAGRIRITPIFLEATSYYDWLFGVRRLLRHGSRPDIIIVGLQARAFVESKVREDYSPMMLFDLIDIFSVARELGISRTETVGLVASHYSVFWDIRSDLRKQLLREAIPGFENLLVLAKSRASLPGGVYFTEIATKRLAALRDLANQYNSRLMILVATVQTPEPERELVAAARRAGVDISVPVGSGSLSNDCFKSDQLHLNAEGAQLFTAAVARDLSARFPYRDLSMTNSQSRRVVNLSGEAGAR
jgi:hypothetical protein